MDAAPKRRAAFAFIFITVLLDMLAFGMVIPVLPKLVERFLDGDTARAAEVYGLFGTVWACMQFISMPVLGALSDRFGRRPVILLSLTGLGLDFALMALAPSLPWLFVGRVISGITAANGSTSSAYIADVTPPEERAAAYGMLGAAFGVGFVIGPAFGGVLGEISPRLPFWVASGLALTNALYGLFVLPESLPPERRAAWSWKRANPVGAIGMLVQRAELRRLAAVRFLADLAHMVLPSTFVLSSSYRFGWSERDVGLLMAGVGVSSMVVQVGLVGRFVKRFGEHITLPLGLAFGVASFATYGLANTVPMFLVGVPLGALWGLAGPAMQALLTRRVAPDEQGRLQGALSTVQGVAAMLGPALFTQTFALAISSGAGLHLPGAPFVVSAVLLMLAALLSLRREPRLAPAT